MDALVGFTGFVGSTLCRQHDFSAVFNRLNIAQAAGSKFDSVVCAAAPGSMFTANRFPEQDAAATEALMEDLRPIKARQFILISSIAVFADFGGDDESSRSFQTALAYGRNRRRLEEFCLQRFGRCLIVRLPALFGCGIRKNFLFDLLNPMPSLLAEPRLAELADRLPAGLGQGLRAIYRHDPSTGLQVIDRAALAATGQRPAYDAAVTALGMSAVQFTHPESHFQYYDMTRLWTDICLSLQAGLDIIHLAPEPLEAGIIHEALLGRPMPATPAKIHREDMRTRHAALWDRPGRYIATSDEVLDRLRQFHAVEREAA
ncbi:hypothetical protein C5F48_21395 [Cereibacter changlensis JA139]|uniref:NAD(P)-dependent oxidoreductase n=3 Tax=Cereibacter changlensis TaxID=402884 RepID=A0A2T4JP98_9RHOB|nr:hypothetical protein C5F48_21395 [Cereibacter changlensis JA139]PZX56229.1 hypothetical protein LX76_01258 [Cereibacter changlensis]